MIPGYNPGMRNTLLLIDIQNDYFPGGRMELEGAREAALRAGRLLDTFRQQPWPTVHIQHIATRPGSAFFLPATPGAGIHALVAPLPGETVIEKHYPNAFRETVLLDHLKKTGTERLVLCGMMTHMCVDASLRAAADLGFQVMVAADACATRSLAYGDTTVPAAHVQATLLAAFKAYGQVLGAEELITQL